MNHGLGIRVKEMIILFIDPDFLLKLVICVNENS